MTPAARRLARRASGLLISLPLVLVAGAASAQLGPAFAGRMAEADNASTVNSNPAAMTRLDHLQVSFDTLVALTDNEFEVDDRTTVSGGDPENDLDYAGLPLFSIHAPLTERFHLGFGVSVPAGLGTDYGDDWAGRYQAQESTLAFISIQPAVAARVTDWLSLGVGAAIMYVRAESKSALQNPGPNAPDGRLKTDFDGVQVGAVLSALVEPWPGGRIGASWRNEIEPRLSGRPKFRGLSPALEAQLEALGLLNQNIKLDIRVPQAVQVGFYEELGERFAVMGDFAWVDWSRFGKVDVRFAGNTLTAKTTFQDIYVGSIGAAYRFDEDWRGRLGFTYVSSGVKNRDRSLALPMDESWVAGAGLMRRFGPALELHANFMAVFGGSGKVDNTGLAGRVAGEFERRQTFVFQLAFVWNPAPEVW